MYLICQYRSRCLIFEHLILQGLRKKSVHFFWLYPGAPKVHRLFAKKWINWLNGKKKKTFKCYDLKGFSSFWEFSRGERGIRTPGPVTVNSFQDCRIRPLCHFSNKSCNHFRIASANIERFFISASVLRTKNNIFYAFFYKTLKFSR